VIQYIATAATLASNIHDYVREQLNHVDDPDELLAEVHLRLVEHDIHSYNDTIREVPELLGALGRGQPLLSSVMILNGIQQRLQNDSQSHAGKLPSQLDFRLLDRDFGAGA
jgi:hypothetical protein